jgi:HAE1 family hydrophobic/amphiphilic exporter-1
MGGQFINFFNEFGRTWQVYVEAEAPYRANLENVGQFYVRNNRGETAPLSTLMNFESRAGPEFTMRYNEYRSTQITGSAAPGYSSDQATAALEDVFKQTMPASRPCLPKWASTTWGCPIRSRRRVKASRLR